MTETLLSLAQLAVAITGFAAIVVVFSRRESGHWRRRGANSFNGMLFHSAAALVFCLLPVALGALDLPALTVWRVASGLLGALLALHAAIVAIRLAAGRSWAARAAVLLLEWPVAGLLLAIAGGAWPERAAGLFVAGVCLQILQAAGLFLELSFVPRADMED
jgi:hypothetical protein